MKRKIMTRIEAIDAGEKYYFSGRPCHKGHLDFRFTLSNQCMECTRELSRERYARIKQKMNKKVTDNGNN